MEPVTIITGATGGMGRAVAADLAARGARLVLTDLDAGALAGLAAEIGQPEAPQVAGGITEPDWTARLIAACAGHPIKGVVHTAGVSPTMGDGARIMEINLFATQALCAAILPHMAQDGAVVLVASNSGHLAARPVMDRLARKLIAGQRPFLARLLMRNSGAAYALSKRAVQLLAVGLAPGFGQRGARILSLSPGIIDTPMGRAEQKQHKEMDRMVAASALGRMGRPEEIASAVAFVLGDGASYISGTDILVDGGTIAGVEAIGGARKL